MARALKIWDSSAWQTVPEVVGQIKTYDGGGWIAAKWVRIWEGTRWEMVWQTEEPPTPGTEFTYYANWAQSYAGTTLNTSSHRDQLNYQGGSSTHGDESSLWGFDDVQMRADLAGKTVLGVIARLTSRWTYAGSGKTFHVMTHNHAAKPSIATFGPIVAQPLLPRSGTETFTLPISVGEDIRDGAVAGIGLKFEEPGEYAWGYCTGMYSTSSPVASPGDGDMVACPQNQLAVLIITVQ